MHAQAMLMFPSRENITLVEKTVGVMQFFLLQAAVITFEDFFQWLERISGRYLRPGMARTYFGYAWVIFSFWYTLPLVGDVMVHMRSGEDQFLPYSLAANWVRLMPPPVQ